MNLYNVHIFREMRLFFPAIEADTPKEAARMAAEKLTDEAETIDDECDGENLAALVDVVYDDGFDQSVMIDFAAERLRKAAPKLLAACRMVVERWEKGDLAEAARMCHEVIVEVEGENSPARKPMIIEVRRGVVQDVRNVPSGADYEIIDHDDRDA